jgi:outer membrane receptor for ferrienterochelin and colicin
MKTKNSLKKILFSIVFLGLLQTGFAQQDTVSTDDLLNLSFADLMNMQVESSTKSSMSIQKAPSSIKVYKQEDFERYGFYTLQDVLNVIPGIQVQEYRGGHQNIWIRGVQQRYNNKVLLLIDGVPVRDNFYGNFTIDESIPIENIEKIEVINGPGSVLYGTNSFAGVVNITTKSAGKSVSAKYGSNNSMKFDAEYDYKGLYASGGYFQTDGFSPEYNYDGKQRTHPQNADNTYGMLKYTNKSLTVIGSYGSYNYPYKYQKSSKDYNYNRTPISASAKYKLDLKDKGNIDFAGYYTYYGFTKDKIKYSDDNHLDGTDTIKEHAFMDMNTALLGGNIDYSITLDKHNLLVGSSYQQDMATNMNEHISYDKVDTSYNENVITDPNISRTDIAFYAQDMFSINEYLLFTGGLRYDILSDFDNQFNYRVGLTGQSSSNIYAKILYGTAYRIPSYREYLDVVSYNTNLKPEHLNTLEVQAGYTFNKGDINITYFNNVYSDFIQEQNVDSIDREDGNGIVEIDDEMAFNFDKRHTSGLELNASLYPTKGLFVNLGASYLLNASENAGTINENTVPAFNSSGDIDLKFLSDFTCNITASYNFLKNYRIGFKAFYFSDRATPDKYQKAIPKPPICVRNTDNANGFVKLDLFARANIIKKLDFDIRVNNILNQQIYSPPYGAPKYYDAEWRGTMFSVGLRYRL